MRRPCCQPGPASGTPPSWHTDSRVTRVTGFTESPYGHLAVWWHLFLFPQSARLPRPVLTEGVRRACRLLQDHPTPNDTIEDDPRLSHSAAQLF
eukprot:596811-Hanusia_phi.AAC.1